MAIFDGFGQQVFLVLSMGEFNSKTIVLNCVRIQGRSENSHYFGLFNIILSQISPEIISIIRDASQLSGIMTKPSRIRFFFEKWLFLVKLHPIKKFHVFCWFGLKYENGVFLSFIVTVFLILNHQMASMYTKTTPIPSRLPMIIIWSYDLDALCLIR